MFRSFRRRRQHLGKSTRLVSHKPFSYNPYSITLRLPDLSAQKGNAVLFAFWEILPGPLNFILLFLGAFLILLVLIQRGKGGGLIGALGGAGGSSPFGSRAGDTFTRITIYVAIVWLILTMIQVRAVQNTASTFQPGPLGRDARQ